MIATKHCDVCDTELPPRAFSYDYQSHDVYLHEKHPNQDWDWIRVSAHPQYTNSSYPNNPDVCPDCMLDMCEKLLLRVRKQVARKRSELHKWKEWRARTRKNESVRIGSDEKVKP